MKNKILELKLEADKCWLTDSTKYKLIIKKLKFYEYKIKNGEAQKLREQDNNIALNGDGYTYRAGQTYFVSANKNRHNQ